MLRPFKRRRPSHHEASLKCIRTMLRLCSRTDPADGRERLRSVQVPGVLANGKCDPRRKLQVSIKRAIDAGAELLERQLRPIQGLESTRSLALLVILLVQTLLQHCGETRSHPQATGRSSASRLARGGRHEGRGYISQSVIYFLTIVTGRN